MWTRFGSSQFWPDQYLIAKRGAPDSPSGMPSQFAVRRASSFAQGHCGPCPKIGARLAVRVLVERTGVLKPGEPFDLARLHAAAVLLIGREVRQAVLIAPRS